MGRCLMMGLLVLVSCTGCRRAIESYRLDDNTAASCTEKVVAGKSTLSCPTPDGFGDGKGLPKSISMGVYVGKLCNPMIMVGGQAYCFAGHANGVCKYDTCNY